MRLILATNPITRPAEGLYVGCAGWNIPSIHAPEFQTQGSHLERYSARLTAVEVNSSFYRPHQRKTYARWRASVPPDFRFSVKLPKQITHLLKLQGAESAVDIFLSETAGLEEKLGCLLVQLPPSLAFDASGAEHFFSYLRSSSGTAIMLEPRHLSWTAHSARTILDRYQVGLVFADPNPLAQSEPATLGDTVYLRLHGSPVIYRSSYSDSYLDAVSQRLAALRANGKNVWCIFDNTANGAATRNAVDLLLRLKRLTAMTARP